MRTVFTALLAGVPAARFEMHCTDMGRSIFGSLQDRGPRLASFARIGMPALLITGTRETAVGDGTREFAEVLPRARMVTLAGAGHDPWFERPRQFFARR